MFESVDSFLIGFVAGAVVCFLLEKAFKWFKKEECCPEECCPEDKVCCEPSLPKDDDKVEVENKVEVIVQTPTPKKRSYKKKS